MVTENDKIADVIKQYPFIKESLIQYNNTFSNLNNSIIFKAIGTIARIKDVAKMSGEDLNSLLCYINKEIKDNI